MLTELTIKNFALIDHLHIEFADGFSVITGETGSGKSIILGALALILGERADTTSIRNKDQKCVIEGCFILNVNDIGPLFEKHDIDFEKNTLIRREITPQGKSRAFVNDTPVSLQILKELSSKLIDIHSQHETLLLGDKAFVFDILDSQLSDKSLLADYVSSYKEYRSLQTQLIKLQEEEAKSQNDKDFYQFLLSEFSEVNLQEALDGEFETEFNLMSHAEEIKSLLAESTQLLDSESLGVLEHLNKISYLFQKLETIDASFEPIKSRIESVLIELNDLASEISRSNDGIDFDPRRLQFLEQKLSSINRLLLKHNVTSIEDLSLKKEELESKIQSIDSISEQITHYKKDIEKLARTLTEKAKAISLDRKQIIPTLEKEAQKLLVRMSMKNAAIQFELSPTDDFTLFGTDQIQLLAKTNLGGSFELLKKIASGGESSRIMLAIKSLQSKNKSLPTIIFDEIDTGVSGEVATNMAEIMKELGTKLQVISITHLPQIASKGSNHYKVFKEEEKNTTHTRILQLSTDERIQEIAQMLSSSKTSQAALDNAIELLNS